jgi:hypothetical protein
MMAAAAVAGAILVGVGVLVYCRQRLMSVWTVPFSGGSAGSKAGDGDRGGGDGGTGRGGKGARSAGEGSAEWSDAWSDEDDWDGGERGKRRKPAVSAHEWVAEDPGWSDREDAADGWGDMEDEEAK